jgi:hypothetical protein
MKLNESDCNIHSVSVNSWWYLDVLLSVTAYDRNMTETAVEEKIMIFSWENGGSVQNR